VNAVDAALFSVDPRKDIAAAAMDIQLGGNVARPPATLTSAEVPKDIQRAQKVAFNHYQDNFIVRAIVDGKAAFFNYGCKLLVKGKPPTPYMLRHWAAEWRDYERMCNGLLAGDVLKAVERYVKDVWRDFLIYDSVVSIYCQIPRVPGGFRYPLPMCVQPFRCTFTNAGGYPKLKIELDWDKKDLPSEPTNFRGGQQSFVFGERNNSEGKLEGEGERWKVTTHGPFGYGFGRPSMASVFRALGQCVSMEAGESVMGYLMRSPMRLHTLGHETRYGPYAGGVQNFWTKKRGEAAKKMLQGVIGFAEFTKNFDHKIEYLWAGSDPDWFSAEKWETVIKRVAWWGQSFAYMYLTRAINPYLFPMFQEEARSQREDVKEHLEAILSVALDTDDLTISWSDECFTDQRLAFEMTKFLTTQGAGSLTTAIRKAGGDPEAEKAQKMAEAKEPDAYLPLLVPGGQGNKATVGRPNGTPDPR
jgi:hypothetical protein